MHYRSQPKKTWCAPLLGLQNSDASIANEINSGVQELAPVNCDGKPSDSRVKQEYYVIYLAYIATYSTLCSTAGFPLRAHATKETKVCRAIRKPGARAQCKGSWPRRASSYPCFDLSDRHHAPIDLNGASTGDYQPPAQGRDGHSDV